MRFWVSARWAAMATAFLLPTRRNADWKLLSINFAFWQWLPKATSMMGVPTFYVRLLDNPGFTRDLVQHIRLFTSGSAPLLAETHVRFEERTGHRILERYGMTETNMNTSNPYDGDRRAGTVGFPLPGVAVKITDPVTGLEMSVGETGMGPAASDGTK